MAGRGRPRKPTTTLKLHGGLRQDRHGDRAKEPKASGAPLKPRGMEKEAAKLWDEIVPELVANGTAKKLDTTIIRVACELWGMYRAAYKVAQKYPTDKDARIAVTSYFTAFERAATKLGISPVDRAKIQVDKPEEESKLGAFARKRS